MSMGVSPVMLFSGELPSGEVTASDIGSKSDMKSDSTVDCLRPLLGPNDCCLAWCGRYVRFGTGVGTRGGGSRSAPGAEGRFAIGLCMCIEDAVEAVTRRSDDLAPNDDLPRQSVCTTFARLRGWPSSL